MQRSPGRWWERARGIPAPLPADPSTASPLERIPQPRDERGRYMRDPTRPRSVTDRASGCEIWTASMRGNTPWENGRAVLTTRWEARYGPIPPGHRLVRLCGMPRHCIRLDHAVLLTPGQAQVYRYAGKERIWLGQEEADEIRALVTAFAERYGISLGAAIAYARWPHGLAEVILHADDAT